MLERKAKQKKREKEEEEEIRTSLDTREKSLSEEERWNI